MTIRKEIYGLNQVGYELQTMAYEEKEINEIRIIQLPDNGSTRFLLIVDRN